MFETSKHTDTPNNVAQINETKGLVQHEKCPHHDMNLVLGDMDPPEASKMELFKTKNVKRNTLSETIM